MSEYDKALLKCLEALSSMVTLVAVLVDDGRISEQEGRLARLLAWPLR